ncbi:hypothetical protein PGT21_004627 [Puccinia graminis f. sp. tritici]|uniref:SAM-dependent MTase RsmB/NOP-type domain-containing protein n=3 Tax=Puccinia graminis f. sp. tritici TaxID=56615 RepID=A0A5B0P762_PUCGR|nr:hypothetical protein PGT21_004627 [Puccinia graminis f. sp. tritici]
MEFYNQAARAIDRVNNKHGSLKSIVFNLAANSNTKNKQPQAGSSASSIKARQVSDGKRLLRVVAETLRYRQVIESILSVVDVLRLESKVFGSSSKSSKGASSKQNERWQHPSAHSLVLILIHDHLFSSRGIALSKIHKIRAAIERHSSALKAELSRLMVRQAVSRVSDLADSFQRGTDSVDEDSGGTNLNSPRWMRVNTIKWSVDQAKGWFIDAGWTQVSSLEALTNQTSDSPDQLLVFAEDEHVTGLLALPSAVVLAKLAPYVDGRLIAQDKASCMPAQLLLGDHPHNPPIEVIDATAAPGNKTTMLSSIVGPRGKVWAFEKDKQRFKVLTEMIKLAGCTNVRCINGDFLAVNHDDERFKDVSCILVDPSCSGSGISNRLDHLSQTDSQKKRDENRIQSLSRFQTTIVSHALRFPSVHQVAYSTCSIWKEENEEVVFRILNKPEMIDKGWSLKEVKDTFLNNSKTPWERTGEVISTKEKHLSERMIRFDPSVDQTIGFFAAVFHRPVPQPGPASAKKAERSTSTAITQKTERAHHPKSSCDQTPLPFAQSPKLIVTGKEKMRTKRTGLFHGIRPGRLISI